MKISSLESNSRNKQLQNNKAFGGNVLVADSERLATKVKSALAGVVYRDNGSLGIRFDGGKYRFSFSKKADEGARVALRGLMEEHGPRIIFEA